MAKKADRISLGNLYQKFEAGEITRVELSDYLKYHSVVNSRLSSIHKLLNMDSGVGSEAAAVLRAELVDLLKIAES